MTRENHMGFLIIVLQGLYVAVDPLRYNVVESSGTVKKSGMSSKVREVESISLLYIVSNNPVA